jgi:peptidoglycan/xylan/chitin deacetylase (PgdA/CDA1 family)
VLATLGAGLAAPLAACGGGGSAASGSTGSAAAGAGASSSPATASGAPSTTTAAGTAPAATTSAAAGASAAGASAAGASPAPQSAGPDLTSGPRTRSAVALTFHGAGDVTILRRMLADFANAGAKVTVLAIGQWLATDPEVAKLVLDGGHDLGNHTWSHQTMPRLPAATTRTEITRAADELRRLTGFEGRWFRPSGTQYSTPVIRSAAAAAGYGACLSYDVDPLDYTDPGADAVVRNFVAGVKPGSIVSLHLGHAGTLAAMPRLLAHLHDRGLAAVTASNLLGLTR